MKKLMVIIGEASGDLHGGSVLQHLQKLQPDLEIFGTGGKRMASTGAKIYYRVEDLAVIGIWEVLKKYSYYKGILNEMIQLLDEKNPDALFLVDYPGFNLRLAAEAKKRGIKVIYYIAPQVWAWKKNRIHKMKTYIDELIVIFPFEVDFFRKEGNMESHCFGHPLIEIAKPSRTKEETFQKWNLDPSKKLVSLLPGSRNFEVEKHLSTLFQTADLISKTRGDIQFIYPLAPTISLKQIQPYLKDISTKIHLIENDTYNVVASSNLAAVCSGTATLETAILQTPLIILYQTSWMSYFIGKHILKMDVIGLPNIVAQKPIMPEMVQKNFTPPKMAEKILHLLDTPEAYQELKDNLKNLHQSLGNMNAYQNTAEFLNQQLQ